MIWLLQLLPHTKYFFERLCLIRLLWLLLHITWLCLEKQVTDGIAFGIPLNLLKLIRHIFHGHKEPIHAVIEGDLDVFEEFDAKIDAQLLHLLQQVVAYRVNFFL